MRAQCGCGNRMRRALESRDFLAFFREQEIRLIWVLNGISKARGMLIHHILQVAATSHDKNIALATQAGLHNDFYIRDGAHADGTQRANHATATKLGAEGANIDVWAGSGIRCIAKFIRISIVAAGVDTYLRAHIHRHLPHGAIHLGKSQEDFRSITQAGAILCHNIVHRPGGTNTGIASNDDLIHPACCPKQKGRLLFRISGAKICWWLVACKRTHRRKWNRWVWIPNYARTVGSTDKLQHPVDGIAVTNQMMKPRQPGSRAVGKLQQIMLSQCAFPGYRGGTRCPGEQFRPVF